jgi:hypothetical protein
MLPPSPVEDAQALEFLWPDRARAGFDHRP